MNPKINLLIRKFAGTAISDYVVAEGSNALELSQSVKRYLMQGYIPFGPMSSCSNASQYGRETYLFQPMIK